MPDSEIKLLMKHLGEAINETLADSPKINERVQDIRDAGYEIFLVIEAKVGFSRKNRDETELLINGPIKLKITPEDAKYLKTLKISVDEQI